MPPVQPGYGVTMKRASLETYAFPGGPVWRQRRADAGRRGGNGAQDR
jgi:hypothetical protein